MISPSEAKGVALGIRQTQQDRHRQTWAVTEQLVTETRIVARFEVQHDGRRHQLTTYAKSRAGAWRVAVRWLKKLQKGKLK